MKNNLLIIFIYFFFNSFTFAETFSFKSNNIEIIDEGNIIHASDGIAISSDNNLELKAKKFEYNKKLGILKAKGNGIAIIKSENLEIKFDTALIDQKKMIINGSGNVEIYQAEEDILILTDSMTYNEMDSMIVARGNVKVNQIGKKIIIETDIINYDKKNNNINSSSRSVLTDKLKNIYDVDNFNYEINRNILKIKNANFRDSNNNNLNTSLAYINTKSNKLFGKDISIDLNKSSFNKNNDPRLKGNSIIINNGITEISKGVFTTCKKRNGKCPPWQLSAEKIQHDKKKKEINYKNALLRVYDLPVMYFPKFFHPDPTVKRRSGFLIPTIKNSPNSTNFLNTPYFFAIAENKDATFSPRFYADDKFLLQTEYRQINSESNHIADFSFFAEKKGNSKNHFFYDYEKDLKITSFEESNIDLKLQKTSNDTYLKASKLNSVLINDSNILENSLSLDLYSDDLSIDTQVKVYEDLNKDRNDRFEYILPKINLVKKIENKTQLKGDFSFNSQNLIRNYDTNTFEKTNINNFIFDSISKISQKGFYNNYNFIFKNSNTDTQKSKNFKEGESHYISGLLQYNSSFPLIKNTEKHKKIIKPKISFKLAPNNTKDISDQVSRIDVSNIYSLNRISENDTIEGGFSVTYGNDFSVFNKKDSREIFSFKLANNLRLDENKDLPGNNQIGQKTSNFFSEISYSPNNFLNTKYNTSIKNNLSDISYEHLITEFKINNFVTTFDYLNENNNKEKNSYISNKTSYSIDDSNSLIFSTRENKTTELTEYYNLIYQYKNDCLAASIEYNKDYYSDRDIKPEESIFFKLTIIPFGKTSSPNLKN